MRLTAYCARLVYFVLCLLLLSSPEVNAFYHPPELIVKGKVTDDDGKPLAGVNVAIKGTSRVVLTDANGEFTLRNVDPAAVLVLTGVNIDTQEFRVNGKSVLDINVRYKVTEIADVVVTGFQKIDRKKFTGSAVTLKGDSIKIDGVTDISRLLEGRAPGVSISR